MTTAREKNIIHEARQDAKVRPADSAYEFTALDAVMKVWHTQEIYSPYYGA
jgi:hypothetical protein